MSSPESQESMSWRAWASKATGWQALQAAKWGMPSSYHSAQVERAPQQSQVVCLIVMVSMVLVYLVRG